MVIFELIHLLFCYLISLSFGLKKTSDQKIIEIFQGDVIKCLALSDHSKPRAI